jgi:hypothetical protein
VRNEYEVRDDCVAIVIPYKGERKVALVDFADLARAQSWPGTFYAMKATTEHTWYAYGCIQEHGQVSRQYLHRWLLQPPADMTIDHINFDGMDNRRRNLRVLSNEENQHHRKLCRTNTSGYRGVGWHKASNKWRAYVQVKRVHHQLGVFNNIEDAARVAAEARAALLPCSIER